jgi:SAM-dependent methyltransferase
MPVLTDEQLYSAPAWGPHCDLEWLKTCSIPQTLQFTIDCLPIIRGLLKDWPREKPVRFLDVGAASGAGASLLASLYPGIFMGPPMIVDAIDKLPDYVDWARAKYPNIGYRSVNIWDLEKPDQPWDIVFCSHIVEHLPEPEKFIARLAEFARHWVLIYTPWMEQNRIAGHNYTVDEALLARAGAVEHWIIDSPAWYNLADAESRCVAFTVRGAA